MKMPQRILKGVQLPQPLFSRSVDPIAFLRCLFFFLRREVRRKETHDTRSPPLVAFLSLSLFFLWRLDTSILLSILAPHIHNKYAVLHETHTHTRYSKARPPASQNSPTMKTQISSLLVLLLPAVAVALPTQQPQQQTHSTDLRRRFTCPANVQDFCSASNIHSSCENGRFTSGAMDTCGECHC